MIFWLEDSHLIWYQNNLKTTHTSLKFLPIKAALLSLVCRAYFQEAEKSIHLFIKVKIFINFELFKQSLFRGRAPSNLSLSKKSKPEKGHVI